MELSKSRLVVIASFFIIFLFVISNNHIFASPLNLNETYIEYGHLIENIKSMEQKPSIKQQIEMGVDIDDVVCNDDKVLVLRWFGNSSVCLTPTTADILVQRGWGIFANANNRPNILFCLTINSIYYENVNEHSNSKILSLIRDAISPDRERWFEIDIWSWGAGFTSEFELLDIVKDRLDKDFDKVTVTSSGPVCI